MPDEALLEECIEAIENAPCNGESLEICGDALYGGLPLGAPCTDSVQCGGPDVFCVPSSSGCGTCDQRPGVGEPCGGGPCALGTRCETTSDTCVAGAPNGAACVADTDCVTWRCILDTCGDAQPDGGACAERDDCASERCEGGICQAHSALGGACAVGADCANERPCIDGVCADRLPAGAACTLDDDCLVGFSCSAGTCEAVVSCSSTGAEGERCSDAYPFIGCAEGLVCYLDACVPPATGGPCWFDDDCPASAYCNGDCMARVPEGAACVEPNECEAGLSCLAGTCAAPFSDGTACVAGSECASGYCDLASGACQVSACR